MTDQQRVKVGAATVSWGPRPYGSPMVIANAPVAAIEDLLAAVQAARQAIRGVEPIDGEAISGKPCADTEYGHICWHCGDGAINPPNCWSCGKPFHCSECGQIDRDAADLSQEARDA